MLEHIEFAGSLGRRGDGVPAAHAFAQSHNTIREYTHAMAKELRVIGLINGSTPLRATRFTCWKSIRALRAPCRL